MWKFIFLVGILATTGAKAAPPSPTPFPPALINTQGFNLGTLEVKNFPLTTADRKKLKLLVKKAVNYTLHEEKNHPSHVYLHTPAVSFTFPLNEKDREDILKLLAAFLTSSNCTGLAAPQIGIHKAALIYTVEADNKKWRKDFTHPVPITLLLNAHYTRQSEEKTADWEGCLSVKTIMGEVDRFNHIKVAAYNTSGLPLSFEAKGFEARVLQHEIDHTDGILFIDKFLHHNRHGSIDEMRALRKQEIEELNK